MNTLLFLILFPLVPAALMLVLPHGKLRRWIVRISVVTIIGASIFTVWSFFPGSTSYFAREPHLVDFGMFCVETLMAAFLLLVSIRKKKPIAAVLAALMYAIMIYFEIYVEPTVKVYEAMFVDKLSLIMVLIIGVIGSLICLYAVDYMKGFQEHHEKLKDKRGLFFCIMFAFISAMFGIVLSNSLVWLFFFWEATTFCSFLLIGYTGTKEATDNAFRALKMNLLGGLAFAIGIVWIAKVNHTLELNVVMASKSVVALFPIVLLCFAGITKSAQMPFSSWLFGAMVAPTPSSALLHSSTMVKAGVYLIIRFAPFISGTWAGSMVALIGGITFVTGAFICVSQTNAKRLLAASTVSNLGLIVACAGVGTYETLWAAIFLIIFHAVAKSLLFLSVGIVEHRIGSRDIEAMDNLIMKMPILTAMIVVGICGMFIAPFGMLISKWAAMRAFIDFASPMGPVLILFIAFGSAVTVFFWTKWLGKITAMNRPSLKSFPKQDNLSKDELTSVLIHAALTICLCFLFPVVSKAFVDPYIETAYRRMVDMGQGNYVLMIIMVSMVIALPLIDYLFQSRLPHDEGKAYMSGRTETGDRTFTGSMGTQKNLVLKNYYLEKYFGEKLHMRIGTISSAAAVVALIGASFL